MNEQPTLGPFGIATVVASLAFILAGIILPEAAEALLRLLLATLAVGFIAARAYAARLPERMTQHVYPPIDAQETARRAAAAPPAVSELAAQLVDADDERRARRAAIPRKVRWTLIDEASRRLSHHHGLRLENPNDHLAIRSLVSEPTWSLIEPGGGSRPDGRPTANSRVIPLSQLHSIIDDLETL